MNARDLVAAAAGKALRPIGFEVRDRLLSERPEGFPGYLVAAQQRGMDVNDYEEKVLGWYPAESILEQTVYPHLRPGTVVCEVGPGTGRFSRGILNRMQGGELHLVDHSPWMVRFLANYFETRAQVRVHLGDGHSLPVTGRGSMDMIFVAGTVIALKLGTIDLYAAEFARVLKPGGLAIFDYIDPTTAEGWDHLKTEGHRLPDVYTYHTADVIERVFSEVGFRDVQRQQIARSTYLTARLSDA